VTSACAGENVAASLEIGLVGPDGSSPSLTQLVRRVEVTGRSFFLTQPASLRLTVLLTIERSENRTAG